MRKLSKNVRVPVRRAVIAIAVVVACYLAGFGGYAVVSAGSSTVTPGTDVASNPNPGEAGDDWGSPWVGSIYTIAGDVWVHGQGSLTIPGQSTPTQKINDDAEAWWYRPLTGEILTEPDEKWTINAWCWIGLETAAESTIWYPPGSDKYSVKALGVTEMTGDFSGFDEAEVGVTNSTALQTSGWEAYDGTGGGPWPQTYADAANRNVKSGPWASTNNEVESNAMVGTHVTGEKLGATVTVNLFVRGQQSIMNDKNKYMTLTSKITGTLADDGQEGWDGWLTSFKESSSGLWEQISEHRIPSGDIVP